MEKEKEKKKKRNGRQSRNPLFTPKSEPGKDVKHNHHHGHEASRVVVAQRYADQHTY